jgi:hypothetical protein
MSNDGDPFLLFTFGHFYFFFWELSQIHLSSWWLYYLFFRFWILIPYYMKKRYPPLMQSFLSILTIISWVLHRSHCLCLYLEVFTLCSLVVVLNFRSYFMAFVSFFYWFLYRVKDRDLVPVIYVWITSFPRTICWRRCLFSNAFFWHMCLEPCEFCSLSLFLGPLLYFIGLSACFTVCTRLFPTVVL